MNSDIGFSEVLRSLYKPEEIMSEKVSDPSE